MIRTILRCRLLLLIRKDCTIPRWFRWLATRRLHGHVTSLIL
jgi:hypothetical protein